MKNSRIEAALGHGAASKEERINIFEPTTHINEDGGNDDATDDVNVCRFVLGSAGYISMVAVSSHQGRYHSVILSFFFY